MKTHESISIASQILAKALAAIFVLALFVLVVSCLWPWFHLHLIAGFAVGLLSFALYLWARAGHLSLSGLFIGFTALALLIYAAAAPYWAYLHSEGALLRVEVVAAIAGRPLSGASVTVVDRLSSKVVSSGITNAEGIVQLNTPILTTVEMSLLGERKQKHLQLHRVFVEASRYSDFEGLLSDVHTDADRMEFRVMLRSNAMNARPAQ